MPAALPRVPTAEAIDMRAAITRMSGGRLYGADALAADVLRGVDRNRAVIVAPRHARAMWRLMRLSPGLVLRLEMAIATRERPRGPAGTRPTPPVAVETSGR